MKKVRWSSICMYDTVCLHGLERYHCIPQKHGGRVCWTSQIRIMRQKNTIQLCALFSDLLLMMRWCFSRFLKIKIDCHNLMPSHWAWGRVLEAQRVKRSGATCIHLRHPFILTFTSVRRPNPHRYSQPSEVRGRKRKQRLKSQ